MNDNQKTVESYEAHVAEYINGTPQTVDGTVKEWIDAAVSELPLDARILEIGSAFGRDATYLQNMGFKIQCTDVTKGFVKLLKEQGFDARELNALTDDLGGPYDLIFAQAVLLHFTPEETKSVIAKAYNALDEGGRFAFTVKQGEGEKWTDEKLNAPRYFCYWTAETLRPVIEATGFSDIKIEGDKATGSAIWVQVIAKK